MLTKRITLLRRKLTLHTNNCLIKWTNTGYGSEFDKAHKSSFDIEEFVLDLLKEAFEEGRSFSNKGGAR